MLTRLLPLARLLSLALGLLALAPLAPAAADPGPSVGIDSPLDQYVRRPQPAFAWSVTKREQRPDGVRWVRMELTSQVWRGITWKHRLNLIVPPAAAGERARPGHAVLFITGKGGQDEHLLVGSTLALRMGVPIAVLHDVPNQPLFGEETGRRLREDALIAYTFQRYLETGEADWPLLFPMVRSAVSAMDALRQFSAREREGWAFGRLEKFVTTGASKRGWTTWLSAVADERVIGIAPIVYDNLNVGKQLELHYQTWGKPSPSIHDYTDAGLLEWMKQERGQHLMGMVDPYVFRARIDVPTMAMIGTNDTYWPLQAVNLYRHELDTPFYTHYVPGAGHSAGLSVIAALAGFFDHVVGRIPDLPEVRLTILPGRKAALLSPLGGATDRIERVRLWGSHVAGRDFTKSSWKRVAASRSGAEWSAPLPPNTLQAAGQAAFIGELELRDSAGERFMVHTPVQIWDLGAPAQK